MFFFVVKYLLMLWKIQKLKKIFQISSLFLPETRATSLSQLPKTATNRPASEVTTGEGDSTSRRRRRLFYGVMREKNEFMSYSFQIPVSEPAAGWRSGVFFLLLDLRKLYGKNSVSDFVVDSWRFSGSGFGRRFEELSFQACFGATQLTQQTFEVSVDVDVAWPKFSLSLLGLGVVRPFVPNLNQF